MASDEVSQPVSVSGAVAAQDAAAAASPVATSSPPQTARGQAVSDVVDEAASPSQSSLPVQERADATAEDAAATRGAAVEASVLAASSGDLLTSEDNTRDAPPEDAAVDAEQACVEAVAGFAAQQAPDEPVEAPREEHVCAEGVSGVVEELLADELGTAQRDEACVEEVSGAVEDAADEVVETALREGVSVEEASGIVGEQMVDEPVHLLQREAVHVEAEVSTLHAPEQVHQEAASLPEEDTDEALGSVHHRGGLQDAAAEASTAATESPSSLPPVEDACVASRDADPLRESVVESEMVSN